MIMIKAASDYRHGLLVRPLLAKRKRSSLGILQAIQAVIPGKGPALGSLTVSLMRCGDPGASVISWPQVLGADPWSLH